MDVCFGTHRCIQLIVKDIFPSDVRYSEDQPLGNDPHQTKKCTDHRILHLNCIVVTSSSLQLIWTQCRWLCELQFRISPWFEYSSSSYSWLCNDADNFDSQNEHAALPIIMMHWCVSELYRGQASVQRSSVPLHPIFIVLCARQKIRTMMPCYRRVQLVSFYSEVRKKSLTLV